MTRKIKAMVTESEMSRMQLLAGLPSKMLLEAMEEESEYDFGGEEEFTDDAPMGDELSAGDEIPGDEMPMDDMPEEGGMEGMGDEIPGEGAIDISPEDAEELVARVVAALEDATGIKMDVEGEVGLEGDMEGMGDEIPGDEMPVDDMPEEGGMDDEPSIPTDEDEDLDALTEMVYQNMKKKYSLKKKQKKLAETKKKLSPAEQKKKLVERVLSRIKNAKTKLNK